VPRYSAMRAHRSIITGRDVLRTCPFGGWRSFSRRASTAVRNGSCSSLTAYATVVQTGNSDLRLLRLLKRTGVDEGECLRSERRLRQSSR
jgi:hypothetical protein